MTTHDIAAALERVQAVLQRRPETGLHDDAPATARWEGGLRIVASHANGMRVSTDMPGELGGTGEHVTPGWLFRAGLASCASTVIAMSAASEGIELSMLEVKACSRSDTRGLFGMADGDGVVVPGGPSDVQLQVRISAPGVSADRLRALVQDSCGRSPVPCAVRSATPVELRIDVAAG